MKAKSPPIVRRWLTREELAQAEKGVNLLQADRLNLQQMRQCLGDEISYRQGGLTWIEQA